MTLRLTVPACSMYSLVHLVIQMTIVATDKRRGLSAAVCRASVPVLLETSFSNFLLLYTDRFVDGRRETDASEWYIPMLGVNLSGGVNYRTTSSTAELCAIRFYLQHILHPRVPPKSVILTLLEHPV